MAIATIGGIPVYNALISDEECGMIRISLVDDPAVMSNFLAFDNDKMMVKYAITDEEKRLVLGCVMRADFPIYRIDPSMGEFYIMYTPEVIRTMAEKYLCENRQNLVNLMHQDGSDVEGVQMVQYFIKDSSKGVNPEAFAECRDGSLFAEFHCTNDEVWNAIKEGTYKGFSLEGVFAIEPNEDAEKVNEIVDTLDGKFSSNKLSKRNHMTKLSRFKASLLKVLAEFGNVTTDKGVLAWDGDEDIKVGDSVYLQGAEGEETPAEDGEYTTEDNTVIVVADGKVAEIKEVEVIPVEEPETPSEEKEEVEAEEGEEEPKAEETPEAEEPKDETEELKARIAELEAENEALKAENEALKAEVEKMRKMSAARPAHEEVKASAEVKSTGVKGLDRIAHLMSL